jgi:hypothetical protein
MQQTIAEAICRQVYEETRTFYAEKERHLGAAAHGFDILHGPPVVTLPTLFLGYQPGETIKTAVAGQEDGWPEECVYPAAPWKLGQHAVRTAGQVILV